MNEDEVGTRMRATCVGGTRRTELAEAMTRMPDTSLQLPGVISLPVTVTQ